jgi:phenylacetate-CoA ligase
VSVLPLAVGSVIDETPGLYRSQIIQTGPKSIRVRLQPKPGATTEQVWRDLAGNLATYLASQGLGNIELVRASEPPEQSARSGKFRQVIAGTHDTAPE